MFKYETTIFIRRPPQQVWEYLIDPENTPKWRSNVISAEWSGTPGIPGSSIHEVQKVMGRTVETVNEVTLWRPPIQFSYTTTGNVSGNVAWTFTPTEGGTNFSLRIELKLNGIVNRILEATGMFARFIDKQNQEDFIRLKENLEGFSVLG